MERHRCMVYFENGRASCAEDKTPCPNQSLLNELTRDMSALSEKQRRRAEVNLGIQTIEARIRATMAELVGDKSKSI